MLNPSTWINSCFLSRSLLALLVHLRSDTSFPAVMQSSIAWQVCRSIIWVCHQSVSPLQQFMLLVLEYSFEEGYRRWAAFLRLTSRSIFSIRTFEMRLVITSLGCCGANFFKVGDVSPEVPFERDITNFEEVGTA